MAMQETGSVAVTELRDRITNGQLQISEYLEQNRCRFLSESNDDRTLAFNETVAVLTQLPTNFLDSQQIQLLLNFLIGQFESALLNGYGSNILKGIWFLMTKCKNVPDFDVAFYVKILYQDNEVQKGWAQQERLWLFELLDWMLTNRMADIKQMGSDFTFAFEHAMAGERDPRCLVLLFKLFQIVVRNVDLGPYGCSLFDAVACYFPISFKPTGNIRITRSELSSLCISCLTASSQFDQSCFLLAEEKLQDEEELSSEQRDDVCQLLVTSCHRFAPIRFVPHCASIVNELVSFVLDPRYKGSDIKSTLIALEAVQENLSKLADKSHIENIIKEQLKHIEPFVLQAAMGITGRALEVAKKMAEVSKTREQVFLQVYAWLIELLQGSGSNAALNKADLVKEALAYLLDWLELSLQFYKVDKIAGYFLTISHSLFSVVDAAKEMAPTEGLIAFYEMAVVTMEMRIFSDALSDAYANAFQLSLRSIDVSVERTSWMKFVRAYAKHMPQAHDKAMMSFLISDKESNRWYYTLCASICDERRWHEWIETLILELFNNITRERMSSFIALWQNFSGDTQKFITDTFIYLFCAIDDAIIRSKLSVSAHETLSVGLQQLAALMDEPVYEAFLEDKYSILVENESYADLFHLDVELLRKLAAQSKGKPISRVYEFAALNKDSAFAIDLEKVDSLDTRLLIIQTKAAMLRGLSGAVELLRKLMWRLAMVEENAVTEELSSDAVWLLEFNSPETTVEQCRYRSSMLWQQRFLVQFVQLYCEIIPQANSAGKKLLLQLLPKTFELGRGIPDSGIYFQKLLPFMVDSLSPSLPSSDLNSILSSLSLVLPSVSVDVQLLGSLVPKLLDILQAENNNMKTCLEVLECLFLLAKPADKQLTSAFSSALNPILSRLLGHKKRIVRKKAADVIHLWSPLIQLH